MDRKERRDNKKMFNILIRKAKQDMAKWILKIDRMPSQEEVLAFQEGYIYGMNRGANDEE
jgi:hypothetical protein